MIAIVFVVLYLIVLPVAGLWFVQRRIARQPSEFQYRLARVSFLLREAQVTLGKQLVPVVQETTRQLNELNELVEAWFDG